MTDSGLETELVFHDKMDLPLFAAFPLLSTDSGRARLLAYYRRYADLASRHNLGLVLESPTWRASADWGRQLGLGATALAELNRAAIHLMEQVRDEYSGRVAEIVISGNLGPRGDGYVPGNQMSAKEAERYHAEQIGVFAGTAADLVSAFTLNYVEEAIGITRAAQRHALPVVISFTVETDGTLPCGLSLEDAVLGVDAATDNGPAYYMINCAHPTHFAHHLTPDKAWVKRLRAVRANASRCSHAELNEAPQLDEGDPAELGRQYAELRARLPHLTVVGGCCGTDHRHIAAICAAVS